MRIDFETLMGVVHGNYVSKNQEACNKTNLKKATKVTDKRA